MKSMFSALLCATIISSVAVAAEPPVAAPAVQSAAPAVTLSTPAQDVLRTGTPVSLKMAEGLTTEGKKLRVGHRFKLEVAEAVSVNGQVVVPAGSIATGEVTDVRNKGMWGKSGAINAQLLYVNVNGRQIRMSGQLDDKGVTGTAGVVGAIAVVPIAGFFVTGTSAKIPVGAPVKGFIDEDVIITFAESPVSQPMVVAPVAAATPTP